MHVQLKGLDMVSRVPCAVIWINDWRFEFSIVRMLEYLFSERWVYRSIC